MPMVSLEELQRARAPVEEFVDRLVVHTKFLVLMEEWQEQIHKSSHLPFATNTATSIWKMETWSNETNLVSIQHIKVQDCCSFIGEETT